MTRDRHAALRIMFPLVLTTLVLGPSLTAGGHELDQTVPDPGYRPHSEHMFEFLDERDTSTVLVLPTIVRRDDRSAHSFASQQQLIAELNKHNIVSATEGRRRVDPGRLRRPSQWEIFEATLESVAELSRSGKVDADYVIVLELLVPTGQSVFGIEIYVLDREGRNAFSLLLNSHHQVFSDANLVAADTSELARSQMIEAATRLAVSALAAQIDRARECAARMAVAPAKAEPGVLHDFESSLSSGTDANGIALGFVAFGDEKTDSRITTTSEHPPRPGEPDSNHVLQLDLEVTSWGGVARTYTNPSVDAWIPVDWKDIDGFSFWLYGNNSGTSLYFHIMDNRNPCSTVEDAERYGVDFADDFAGWKRYTIAFADLERVEIWNGAPDDGLDLTHVHGWGFGTGATDGSLTYYIDDFELWQAEIRNSM